MLNKHFRAVSRQIVDSRMAAPAVVVRGQRKVVNHVEFDFDVTGKTLPELLEEGLLAAFRNEITPRWLNEIVYASQGDGSGAYEYGLKW
jgi:hypothetical protein